MQERLQYFAELEKLRYLYMAWLFNPEAFDEQANPIYDLFETLASPPFNGPLGPTVYAARSWMSWDQAHEDRKGEGDHEVEYATGQPFYAGQEPEEFDADVEKVVAETLKPGYEREESTRMELPKPAELFPIATSEEAEVFGPLMVEAISQGLGETINRLYGLANRDK